MKARLLIADDHQVVRQGLCDMISRTSDLSVVGEAGDGAAAEAMARRVDADLMVLDIALPVRRGIEVLESLRADGIQLPILLFSMYPASQYVDYARRAGAQGFVGKDADGQALLNAIRNILKGGCCFPANARSGNRALPGGDPFSALSRREFDVMKAIAGGASIVDIAASMKISSQSVSTYRRRLLEKLGVASNAELVALAIYHDQF